MTDGKRTTRRQSVKDTADYSKTRLDQLPLEYKRFDNPHVYKIGLSQNLKSQRQEMIEQSKKNYTE